MSGYINNNNSNDIVEFKGIYYNIGFLFYIGSGLVCKGDNWRNVEFREGSWSGLYLIILSKEFYNFLFFRV